MKKFHPSFIIRRFKYNNLSDLKFHSSKIYYFIYARKLRYFFSSFLLYFHFQIKFLHNQVNQIISPLFSRIWGGSHVFPLLRQPSTLMSHNFFNFQNERESPLLPYYKNQAWVSPSRLLRTVSAPYKRENKSRENKKPFTCEQASKENTRFDQESVECTDIGRPRTFRWQLTIQ